MANKIGKTIAWRILYKKGWLSGWRDLPRVPRGGPVSGIGRYRLVTPDGDRVGIPSGDISPGTAVMLMRVLARVHAIKPSNDPRVAVFGDWVWQLSQSESLLNNEELRLVLQEAIGKDERRFERLRADHEHTDTSKGTRREVITEEVRAVVWRRDEGQCVQCGSQERLEFDHIIPVSKGGSNTARNLQLLCEQCNRSKSDHI